jgi:hypothetical protein
VPVGERVDIQPMGRGMTQACGLVEYKKTILRELQVGLGKLGADVADRP